MALLRKNIIILCSVIALSFSQIAVAQELTDPLHDDTFILEWAENAVTESGHLRYDTYLHKMPRLKKFFTEKGFENYRTDLKDSHLLNFLDAKKSKMETRFLRPPRICTTEESDGIFYWAVTAPTQIKYTRLDTMAEHLMPPRKLTVIIARTDNPKNTDNIGIEVWSYQKKELTEDQIDMDFCTIDNRKRELVRFLASLPIQTLKKVKEHRKKLSAPDNTNASLCSLIDTMPPNLKDEIAQHYTIKNCKKAETGEP